MNRATYPAEVDSLIAQLKRLPGVGPRGAERIALWMIRNPDARTERLVTALDEVRAAVHPCTECGFFATSGLCGICSDPQRDQGILCVVELATDILPIERSGAYRGLYHALGGRISPLDHIGPEDLRISSLLARANSGQLSEIILALSADVEGEATANYLADTLRDTAVRVTRIAQGLPAGGGLDHADALTLHRALTNRR